MPTPSTPSTRRVAHVPTGAAAPTDPPTQVDPAVQSMMERVEPASGYALARLVMAEERESRFGLPADTEALLDSAMLEVLTLHSSDDQFAREVPPGTIVFASLEGLAPLLRTRVFLLPLERVQGTFPAENVDAAGPIGFTG